MGDIQDVIETALAGRNTSDLWEGERRFAVMVRLHPSQRNLDALQHLLVPTPSGAQVPLSQLAKVSHGSGAMNIARENDRRVASVGIFIRDRDMGSVVADLQAAAAREVKLPQGYEIVWSGEFENQQRAMKRLSWVVPLSILVIFLLLCDAFNSFRSALLIIANIPFAMIGGIIALAMLGLLPMALSHAIGAETQRPLAVVVIGGLVTATLLTLLVLLAVVGTAALTLTALQWRWVARHLSVASRWSLRRRAAIALGLTLLPVLSFGVVDSRYKEFSADAQLNEIAGNGYYDFFHALRHNELDYERLYRTLDPETLARTLAARYSGTQATQMLNRNSWQRDIPASRPEQGLNFTRVHATGTRTVRGLEALSLSVPPTPGHAIVTRPANGGLQTIGHVLRERGYGTSYLYGGYATFDNMRNFFGGNGYTVIDRSAIPSERIHHETIWGVADEDLFDMALDQLDAQAATGKPFFAHIMSTSNHRPYTYPEGRIDIPSKSGREGGDDRNGRDDPAQPRETPQQTHLGEDHLQGLSKHRDTVWTPWPGWPCRWSDQVSTLGARS